MSSSLRLLRLAFAANGFELVHRTKAGFYVYHNYSNHKTEIVEEYADRRGVIRWKLRPQGITDDLG